MKWPGYGEGRHKTRSTECGDARTDWAALLVVRWRNENKWVGLEGCPVVNAEADSIVAEHENGSQWMRDFRDISAADDSVLDLAQGSSETSVGGENIHSGKTVLDCSQRACREMSTVDRNVVEMHGPAAGQMHMDRVEGRLVDAEFGSALVYAEGRDIARHWRSTTMTECVDTATAANDMTTRWQGNESRDGSRTAAVEAPVGHDSLRHRARQSHRRQEGRGEVAFVAIRARYAPWEAWTNRCG